MSVTAVNQDVFATATGMSLTATAEEGGNIISINGDTSSNITDITIRVISPNGSNVVGVDQVTPNANGEFSTEFKVCLLYTSPSPRDLSTSRMPSSA